MNRYCVLVLVVSGFALTLEPALAENSPEANDSSAEANWFNGKLERDGRWIDFNVAAHELADQPLLKEYREKRDAALFTAKSQLELANWCKAHKLADRERAHLVAALELSPNRQDAGICARLGLRRIDGVWMSTKEIQTEKVEQAVARRNLKKWEPVITRLAEKLNRNNEKVRAQARDELSAMQDVSVLPAMEVVLAEKGFGSATFLVDLLGAFPSVKAAAPLARLAVNSEWQTVRKSAATKLRERPVGSYAPELLASMRTPIDSTVNIFIGADGVHLTQELTSETQTSVQHLERRFSTFIEQTSLRSIGGRGPLEADLASGRLSRVTDAAETAANDEANAVASEVEQENDDIKNWNTRVCQVLADATGMQLPADPEPWWEWWREYNQLSAFSKSQEYQTTYEAEYIPSPQPQTECLVGGTLIATDRGMVPIERVHVGDLVLSKHPETGELTYQPVLRTSERAPEPIMKLTTDRGTLRSTFGHHFWISGRGWTRLRDVKSGDRMVGVRDMQSVQSVKDDGEEKTYNLVVADFHTYFAGSPLVLSHDLTFARPVDPTLHVAKSE